MKPQVLQSLNFRTCCMKELGKYCFREKVELFQLIARQVDARYGPFFWKWCQQTWNGCPQLGPVACWNSHAKLFNKNATQAQHQNVKRVLHARIELMVHFILNKGEKKRTLAQIELLNQSPAPRAHMAFFLATPPFVSSSESPLNAGVRGWIFMKKTTFEAVS